MCIKSCRLLPNYNNSIVYLFKTYSEFFLFLKRVGHLMFYRSKIKHIFLIVVMLPLKFEPVLQIAFVPNETVT